MHSSMVLNLRCWRIDLRIAQTYTETTELPLTSLFRFARIRYKGSLLYTFSFLLLLTYFGSRKVCAGPSKRGKAQGLAAKKVNSKKARKADPKKAQKRTPGKAAVDRAKVSAGTLQKDRKRWFGDDFPLKNSLHLIPDITGKQQKQIWSLVRQAKLHDAQRIVERRAKRLQPFRRDRLLLRWGHQLMSLGESEKANAVYRGLFASKQGKVSLIALVMASRDLFTQRRYTEVLRVLRKLPKVSKKVTLDRYLSAGILLRASAFRRLRRYQEANRDLSVLIIRKTLIADYAFYLKVLNLFVARRYQQVFRIAAQAMKAYPKNRFGLRIQYFAARSYEALKKYRKAEQKYRLLLTKGLRTRGSFSKSLFWLRLAYCRANGSFRSLPSTQRSRVKALLVKILKKTPGSSIADKAYRIWKRIFPGRAPLAERYMLTYHLFRRGRLELAEGGFGGLFTEGKRLLAAHRKTSKQKAKTGGKGKNPKKAGAKKPSRKKGSKRIFAYRDLLAKSAYHHGFVLFRLKRYEEACRSLLWVRKHFASHRLGRSAYFYWARSNYRLKKNLKAVSEYLKFWSRNQRNSHGKKALWYGSQMMMEHGRYTRAVQLFRKHAKLYPRDRWGREIPIKLALVYYQQKKYAKAIKELRKKAVRSPNLAARAWFWIGKSYEKLKKKSEARSAFGRIGKFSDAYYWARAQERLAGRTFFARKHVSLYHLLPDDREEQASEKRIRAWYRRHYGKKRNVTSFSNSALRTVEARKAYLLALAGHFHEVGFYFRMLKRRFRQPLINYFLARAWLAFGRANKTIRLGFRFRSRLGSKRSGFPGIVLRRLLFPIPFPALYMRFGKMYKIRPLLFLSLTRQESVFDPAAVSGAGAIGIAQIMPKEAVLIAKKWSLTGYTRDWLYRPQLNLKMGMYHFHDYLEKHGNVVELTLAAYNAGPNALKRWVGLDTRLPKRDLEAFVAYGIGYRETRRYVPACLRWYTSYRLLR